MKRNKVPLDGHPEHGSYEVSETGRSSKGAYSVEDDNVVTGLNSAS